MMQSTRWKYVNNQTNTHFTGVPDFFYVSGFSQEKQKIDQRVYKNRII